ncbi:PorV/PorQ family protein [Rhodocaloribacter litoris]|uniref:PorV/PorQ family protein n=1 Tax=Rhodocaloribacter litoris TaxID=2558931 RepID=UPI001E636E05|nr:PorV/PorQ family protein [Rhodocaloribacter litoris]QXD15181.1 PorV/PorQ family protein [Rhodocaloribacter litoris]GIV60455.1 MAG: hypothetical protein KatS3mg043_1544 [Rhodothermaceae bacterium]
MQKRREEKRRGHPSPRPPRQHVLRLVLGLAIFLLPASASAQVLPSFGGDRAGTSGFQFLKIAADARGAALGETVVASAFDAGALFWNPALAAQFDGLHVGLHHTAYFAGVTLDFLAVAYPLRGTGLTLGASLQTMDSGEMDVTTEFQPFGTGERFRFFDLAAGLTLAQRLTDLFSYGVTGKYVRESVAGLTTSTLVFDLGIFYRIGDTGAQMAVAIRNFGFDGRPGGRLRRTVIGNPSEVIETDFAAITPPTTFLFGATYNLLHRDARNDLFVSAQLNNPNDNAETWNVGLEYVWHETLTLRAGYRFGVEEFTLPSLGLGLHIPYLGPDLRFDYGFNRLERLGTVHRIGLNLKG